MQGIVGREELGPREEVEQGSDLTTMSVTGILLREAIDFLQERVWRRRETRGDRAETSRGDRDKERGPV